MLRAILAAAVATATPEGLERAAESLRREMAMQCPAKRLDWIAPAVLQEELLRYRVPAAASAARDAGWKRYCDPKSFDSTCGNVVAMEALDRFGGMESFVRQLCARWRTCEEQSDCTPARARSRH